MKPTRHPSPSVIQAVVSFNHFGGGLFYKRYVPFSKVLPQRVCYFHMLDVKIHRIKFIEIDHIRPRIAVTRKWI